MPSDSIEGDSSANLPVDTQGRLYHLGLTSGEGKQQTSRESLK